MGLDTNIPLQAKAPELNPLATLLQIGQYKYLQQNSNKLQMDMDANQAVGRAIQRNTDANGNVNLLMVQRDLASDPSAAFGLQGATGTNLTQQGQQATNAGQQISNNAAQFKLSGDQLEKASQIGAGLLSDPDISSGDLTKMLPKIQDAKQRMIEAGIPAQTAEVQAAHLITAAAHDPKGVPQLLRNSILQSMPANQQAVAIKPDVVQTDNGQEIVSTNFNPLAEGGVGSQPIKPIQKQLPPTTPTYDPDTKTKGYLGPQPVADSSALPNIKPDDQNIRDNDRLAILQQELHDATNPKDRAAIQREIDSTTKGIQLRGGKSAQAPARVMSEPPVGAVAGVEGSQGAINDHWKALNDQAGKAGTDISLLQNIKQFAHTAATGQLADRESFINGIAARLGMSSADLKKTDTDLLAKNTAMLSLVGGNTDAARALAEAANPNIKMNETAIRHAADQIISQKQLSVAQQKYLLPFKALADQGHPEVYQAAKAKFDAVADPRILQLPSMSHEEVAKMKAAMSPKERTEFGTKIRTLQSLGIIQ